MSENKKKISKQYPATIAKSIDGVFISAGEMYLKDIGKKVANCVVARYYKGIEGDNSNAVLVVYED